MMESNKVKIAFAEYYKDPEWNIAFTVQCCFIKINVFSYHASSVGQLMLKYSHSVCFFFISQNHLIHT